MNNCIEALHELELNGVTCDQSFQEIIDDGFHFMFSNINAAISASSLQAICECTCPVTRIQNLLQPIKIWLDFSEIDFVVSKLQE